MADHPFLQILGTGHSEAMEHWNTNAMIVSSGRRLLIDCGFTIKYALRDRGLGLPDIDAIFITHVHGDHVFGLERVGYESRFRYGKRVQLILHESLQEELWDQTLKGSMGRASEGENTLADFFDVVLLRDDRFDWQGVHCKLFRTRHTPNKISYGLHINEQVIFTSDTTPIPEQIATLPAHTIFHDVTLRDEHPVHAAVPALLSAYTPEMRKKMYLMSYEDYWRDWEPQIQREFAGFAKQGQIVTIENL
ncbi:conserved hypothetical protein [gamma proteobacterium HdN1]|nr:conserved hypothetical protein [gamma proteobacterium HdN1]